MRRPRSLPLKGSVHSRNSELHNALPPEPMKIQGNSEYKECRHRDGRILYISTQVLELRG